MLRDGFGKTVSSVTQLPVDLGHLDTASTLLTENCSMLGLPVELNGSVSDAIPF